MAGVAATATRNILHRVNSTNALFSLFDLPNCQQKGFTNVQCIQLYHPTWSNVSRNRNRFPRDYTDESLAAYRLPANIFKHQFKIVSIYSIRNISIHYKTREILPYIRYKFFNVFFQIYTY